ncbi:hypothetical protein GUITHDRAFT_153404, partial [Guillardia theta CCMP2712]
MSSRDEEALHALVLVPTSSTLQVKQPWRAVVAGMLVAVLVLFAVSTPSSSREKDELTLRSATLTIKDLANEYDLENHFGEGQEDSFSFCGKSVLNQREVRLCAERFLSLLSGHTQGRVKEHSSQLWGLPHLTAYSRCTRAKTIDQVKGCIRSVTAALSKRAIIQHQRQGTSEFDKGLEEVAEESVKRVQGSDPIEGLNGGMNGETSEGSNSKYLQEKARGAQEGMVPGCEKLGISGCASVKDGGLRPSVK